MPRPRHVPERNCAACGQKFPKQALTRIVRTPQGAIWVDPTGRAVGRGTYLCSASSCWERGIHKGSVGRGLHASIPADDLENILAFYRQQIASTVSER